MWFLFQPIPTVTLDNSGGFIVTYRHGWGTTTDVTPLRLCPPPPRFPYWRSLVSQGGADPESRTLYDGRTPLHLACLGGHVELVAYLVRMGAKSTSVDMVSWVGSCLLCPLDCLGDSAAATIECSSSPCPCSFVHGARRAPLPSPDSLDVILHCDAPHPCSTPFLCLSCCRPCNPCD